MNTQPEALRLADELGVEFAQGRISNHNGRKAAAELRRLHEVNQELLEALKLALYHIEAGAHNRRYIRHVIREALAEESSGTEQPAPVAEPHEQQYASRAEQDLYEDEDEQPAQQEEPFGYITGVPEWGIRQSEITVKITRNAQPQYGFVNAVYTSPPYEATPLASQRSVKPWEVLTIKEIYQCEPKKDWYDPAEFARAIEAKLREKNEPREKNT